ncbi:MAG: serine hydrolase domain-containing protein [Bacteroidota bacterium]
MKHLPASLLILSLSISFSYSQTYTDSLHIALDKAFAQIQLPGFACLIATKDSILYQRGFGLADRENMIPFTEHTIQSIGSITKTFLALAVMQLVEQKKLRLQSRINDLLPFSVHHPIYPDHPITVKHLVTHTSGIQDSYWDVVKATIMIEKFDLKNMTFPEEYYQHAKAFNKNRFMPLGTYLKRMLDKKGRWYDANKSFTTYEPGSNYQYSNIASALCGYIVECVSGQRFDEYVAQHILHPLNMTNAHWTFGEMVETDHAVGYFDNGAIVPPSYYIIYPAGGLRTSVSELGLYVQEMLRGMQGEGTLLSPSSYRIMFTTQFEGGDHPGVFWDTSPTSINHNGGSQGTYNLLLLNKKNQIGKILMTNTHAHWFDHLENQFHSIWRTMTTYQELLKP